MKRSYHVAGEKLEAGIDEVARGCLAGPVYSAAVIWPSELDPEDEWNEVFIKDSKKLSRKKREELRYYIEDNAIDFCVASSDNKHIDEVNIRNATFDTMHKALNGMYVEPDFLLVDGHVFRNYYNKQGVHIPHTCVISGDNTYIPIACASILAKVYHDEYINRICDENHEYNIYEWKNNMCYGTKPHLDAIKDYGITPLHRSTFGICMFAEKNPNFSW
jgi:ribonuclease HII